ncbi:hypothetical protein NST33_17865 [Paenibacillus sp. FSL L8-0435]|uniref:hypothetical protein n=1 Tax=Paenibacillus sp. FSL L8-0435 TaxID=2954618 RepID=UPI0030DD1C57
MKKTVNENWLNPSMTTVDHYEGAITVLSSENDYDGKEDDWKVIMHYINDYDDLKIDNVYQIIYEQQPFNFMKVLQ